jgi:hypothetical protein
MASPIPNFREFIWKRDLKGYRLWDSERRVVASGVKQETYKPFERHENLFGQFAIIPKTPEGVLDFITKFGPLTREGLEDRGEDVAAVLEGAESMAGLLQTAEGRQSTSQLSSQRKSIYLTMEFANPSSGRLLTIVPDTLLDGMWLQLAEALSGDAQLLRCIQCGVWFAAGASFGRRRETKFCSDEHRILYNSLKRSRQFAARSANERG